MRLVPIIAKPVLLTLLGFFTIAGGQESGDHVKLAMELATDTLGAGASSEILLTFRPGKGYHVNAVPPVGLALDSGVAAILADSVIVPRDSATGYLNVRRMVRQTFTVPGLTRPGRMLLTGTVTYYYCSDAEGWCRREKIPFSLPLTIR